LKKKIITIVKKTLDFIWRVKLKIIIIIIKKFKQKYYYWKTTIDLIWMVKLKIIIITTTTILFIIVNIINITIKKIFKNIITIEKKIVIKSHLGWIRPHPIN